tara:strand:- start:594 stop:896 length:303 start_codon:yes stop_codon:yes gene_type:complete
MAKLSRTEQYEVNFQRFINNYKWKTKEEIINSTLKIESSTISEFELILLDALRVGNLDNNSIGYLSQMKSVLSRLISENEQAREYLKTRLSIVQDTLQKK